MKRATQTAILFFLAGLLISYGLSSCAKKDTSKLAQALIHAGFIPLEKHERRSGEKTEISSKEGSTYVSYANGYLSLDGQGRIYGLLANPFHANPSVHLSALSLGTYEGREILSFTRQEIIGLFGIQKVNQERVSAYYFTPCLGYIFHTDDKAYVIVLIGFDGPTDSAKVSSVEATYSPILPKWAGNNSGDAAWPNAR